MKLAQLFKTTPEVHREVRDSPVPTVGNGSALYAAFKENACEIYMSSAPEKASFSRQPSESYDPPFPGGQEASNNRNTPLQLEETLTRRHTRATAHARTHRRICIQVL